MPNYFLFRASRKTYNQCIQLMLVGQQQYNSNDVLQVKKGDIIFIHFTGQMLPIENQFIEGPYFALSDGQKDIISDAWDGDFPWQVKIEKKGNVARIKQNSFNKFSLRYSGSESFIKIVLPENIGRKLMNEMGIETKTINNELKVNSWDVANEQEIDVRLRYEAKFRCEDGHYVRSKNEVIVDNWLFNHNISHAYEKKVLDYNMLSDFYIRFKNSKEYYIEVWGLNDPTYLKRKQEKINLYNKKNLNLISINENIIQNIDDYMLKRFSDYI
jgi:hypothetical protein